MTEGAGFGDGSGRLNRSIPEPLAHQHPAYPSAKNLAQLASLRYGGSTKEPAQPLAHHSCHVTPESSVKYEVCGVTT